MDEVQRITTGFMRLVVCDIFIPHLSSKDRAYNSKGELKILLFMDVLLLVCNLTCRYICFRGGYNGRGRGYTGRVSGYTGRGRGSGYTGRGRGYKGRGMGIRGGGIQHQEYIMTFNEVLNTIAHNRYTYSFVMLYKFPFGLEFKFVFLLFWPILKLILFFITRVYVVVHLGDYQA